MLGNSSKKPSREKLQTTDETARDGKVCRGSYGKYMNTYDGIELSSVSWKDNKQVTLLSIYIGAEPLLLSKDMTNLKRGRSLWHVQKL